MVAGKKISVGTTAVNISSALGVAGTVVIRVKANSQVWAGGSNVGVDDGYQLSSGAEEFVLQDGDDLYLIANPATSVYTIAFSL